MVAPAGVCKEPKNERDGYIEEVQKKKKRNNPIQGFSHTTKSWRRRGGDESKFSSLVAYTVVLMSKKEEVSGPATSFLSLHRDPMQPSGHICLLPFS